MRHRAPVTVIIASIGMGILLRNTSLAVFGADPVRIQSFLGDGVVTLGGIAIAKHYLLILVATAAIFMGQSFFFNRTCIGRKLDATAQNQEMARLMGINVNWMITLTFVLSAMLASIAGFLIGPIFFLEPDLGLMIILKAFIVIVIGGFGSIRGVVVAGLFLGVVEVLVASHLTSEYKDVISFLVLIFVLIFLPQGILRRENWSEKYKCGDDDELKREKLLYCCSCLCCGHGSPLFLRGLRYHMNILNLAGIFIILTYSLNFIHGYLGLISIGQAGFFAIGAYLTAGLTMGLGLNFFPSLIIAAIGAAVSGVLIGFPATRISGHYYVLITLGFGEIVRLILMNWKEVTNGTNGINNIPFPRLGPLLFDSRTSYFYLVMFFLVLTIMITVSYRRSKYGRSALALKVSEIAGSVMGVNPLTTKLVNFGLSAFVAGIAGGLYAAYITSISPEPFSVGLSVDVLTMLLVGGSGTIAGPIIGAAFLVVLRDSLRFLQEYYMIIYGAGIVAVMIFMPEGIMGLIRRFTDRAKS